MTSSFRRNSRFLAKILVQLTATFAAVVCGYSARAQATGGSVSQSGSTYTHVFTGSGSFNVPSGGIQNVSVWIVAGGGGGGQEWGGGGGAGGLLSRTLNVTGGSYPIVVGAGGANSQSGQNSSAFGLTAVGGGAGGRGSGGNGTAGGSGGGGASGISAGAGASNTAGQGNRGGDGYAVGEWVPDMGAGGGGGASEMGQPGSSSGAGRGGAGVTIQTPTATFYVCGGGGGGTGGWNGGTASYGGGNGGNGVGLVAGSAAANTGSGGGGGAGNQSPGGSGGSGIVIITYTYSPPIVVKVSGDNQSASVGQLNAQPFDAAVWNSAGTQPIVGTSLTFAVQSGGGLLAATTTSTPTTSITVTTDVDGTGKVYYQQPATVGITSQITASSGGAQATFTTQSIAPTIPPNAPPWARTATSAPTSISFSWGNATPASGGAAISGYNIYRNGTLLNSSPQLSTSYTDTTVVAGTAYTYTVKAVDTAGTLSTATTLNVSTPASSTSGPFDLYIPTL